MGPDIDLEDDRILGTGKVVEGLAALRTTTLLRGELVVLDDSREVGIITSFGTGLAGLLASGPTRWRVGRGGERGGRWGRSSGLGFSTEELLLTEAEQSLKPLDLSFELGLACEGAAMLGLPVGGLAPGLEFLLQAWANRTGAMGDGRSRADRSGQRFGRRRRSSESVQFRDRDPDGMEAEYGGRVVIHGRRV
jgi:hypothetical protein